MSQNTYRILKAFREIGCYWEIWRSIWVVNSRSCINPLCFRWTYNFGSHTGEIEGFMPYKWQGRLVFAPIWLAHEDQAMSTHKCWSGKNKVTEWTYMKCTYIKQTNKSGSVWKKWKVSGFYQQTTFQKHEGLDYVNNEKTSKFAESFCKPGLGIIFWYHKLVGLGRLNALPHLTSVTKKHNNGMQKISWEGTRTWSCSLLHQLVMVL